VLLREEVYLPSFTYFIKTMTIKSFLGVFSLSLSICENLDVLLIDDEAKELGVFVAYTLA